MKVNSYIDKIALFCLLTLLLPSANAGVLIASDDTFSIPSSRVLLVEALGVLGNDTLNGETAGVSSTIFSSVTKGTLSCPSDPSLELCADGSFSYTPDSLTFDGFDSFQYTATGSAGESAIATVTLSACKTDKINPALTSCWHENAFLTVSASLGYHVFRESFEGTPWNSARYPATLASVSSRNISWTTNFPLSNNISTDPGSARSGQWGAYDPNHGLAQDNNPVNCDTNVVPETCKPFDGLSGSGTSLTAVGGYFASVTSSPNPNIGIILDGGNVYPIGKLPPDFHFFGLINTAGFSTFEFRELDGKTGQELPVFGDDFVIATNQPIAANNPPILSPIGAQSIDEGKKLTLIFSASDVDDGDLLSYQVQGLPPGASFVDFTDGSGRLNWTPGYSQAGSYDVTVIVSDNAIPPASNSETFTITVNNFNRAPVLSPIGNQVVLAGNTLSLMLNASDADADLLSFSATGAPTGSSLLDNGDGTAEFSWMPDSTQAGAHSITFTVTDDGMPAQADAETISVQVEVPDVIPPVITLKGVTPVFIEQGLTYVDAGATASDNIDGDISANIVMTGSVDTAIAASYLLTYRVTDAAGNPAIPVVRTVNVTPDNTPPNVSAPASITVAASDATGTAASHSAISSFLNGATASDAVDGIIATLSNDAPTRFPLGTTIVTFSASDSAGNTGYAQSSVTISDQTAPVISLLGNASITLGVGDSYSEAGATASDNVDGDLSSQIIVSSNVNTAAVGLYQVSYNVSDAAGNPAVTVTRNISVQDTNASNLPPLANAGADQSVAIGQMVSLDGHASSDPDNDPLSFNWRIIMTPVDSLVQLSDPTASSISLTPDKQGEYILELTVNDGRAYSVPDRVSVHVEPDKIPPEVMVPEPIIMPAQGLLTYVDLGTASALDNVSGALVAVTKEGGYFNPGHHYVLWTATDSSGNTGEALQSVDVQPLIEISPDQQVTSGSLAGIKLLLNGTAASYPVIANIELFNDDLSQLLKKIQIEIMNGQSEEFNYKIPDSISSGSISVHIKIVENAVKGPKSIHKLFIVNENLSPLARLAITQNGLPTRTVIRNGGKVTIRALATDANAGDQLFYDWNGTDNALYSPEWDKNSSSFTFSPDLLETGFYKINVRIQDDGVPVKVTEKETYLAVSDAPVLSPDLDSDNDGIDDKTEGYGDADGDGIPDYLDAVSQPNYLQGSGLSQQWLLGTESGLTLKLGNIALLSGQNMARVSEQAIQAISETLSVSVPANSADSNFEHIDDDFDFKVDGLGYAGQSVFIVIPQLNPIIEGAVYRKYTVENGWSNFVENETNRLYSASAEPGYCPPSGSDAYLPGLNVGDNCIQLLIEDGGPNDGDHLINGEISDPGGLAIPKTPAATGSGGGGSQDWNLLLLLILYTGRHLKQRAGKAVG